MVKRIGLRAAEIAFPFVANLPSRQKEFILPDIEISKIDDHFFALVPRDSECHLYIAYDDRSAVPVTRLDPDETIGATLSIFDLAAARCILLHIKGVRSKAKDTGTEKYSMLMIKMLDSG